LEKYFTKYPEDADKVVLSIKGGLNNMLPDGSPENVRRSVDTCINLLKGKKKIDIFECARGMAIGACLICPSIIPLTVKITDSTEFCGAHQS
jgi:aryl-alcohol dehydrogenase-like predicted oxidoreductase